MSTSVVARRVCATPVRSASEVWELVTDLIARSDGSARRDLDSIAGVAMAIIAAEGPRTSPIILAGVGPQLRIYCLYDEDAIIGQEANEDPLSWCPTDGDWGLSLPCPTEDLDWVTTELTAATSRVTARDISQPPTTAASATKGTVPELGPINAEAFRHR